MNNTASKLMPLINRFKPSIGLRIPKTSPKNHCMKWTRHWGQSCVTQVGVEHGAGGQLWGVVGWGMGQGRNGC